MRCIEIEITQNQDANTQRLIETWDVLKCVIQRNSPSWIVMINRNMRCIEMTISVPLIVLIWVWLIETWDVLKYFSMILVFLLLID